MAETVITSAANPEIKAIRALATKKGRQQQNAFVSEGLRHVVEAARAGWAIRRLIVADRQAPSPAMEEARRACREAGGRVITVSADLMSRIAKRDNAQSVIAVIEQKTSPLSLVVAEPGALWVALESVRDPGNLGSVMRSADAFGAKGVMLIGNTVDPFSVEAVRATMGAIVNVPLVRCDEREFLDWRASWPGRVVGTHLAGPHRPDGLRSETPTVLLMGNEQAGLPPEMARACDTLVRIPMRPGADSLNLAAATAIMLHGLAGGAGDLE
ncbi:MAG: RNA methyltransferase [Alphaproteobacteria bacterium]|nr:RNA methyltransferase [Alphaproteobacteria bacterium]